MNIVTINALGTIRFNQNYNRFDLLSPFTSDVLRVLGDSEGSMGVMGIPIIEDSNIHEYEFEAMDVENIHWLQLARFFYLSLDDPFVMNKQVEGITSTINELDTIGIIHTGGGIDKSRASKTVYSTINGVRFGFIAFSTKNTCVSSISSAGVSYIDVDSEDKEYYKDKISKLLLDVNHLIIHIYWIQGEYRKVDWFIKFAKELIVSGARIVIGHGSSGLWPIIPYLDGLICISLGDIGENYGSIVGLKFSHTRLVTWKRTNTFTNNRQTSIFVEK